jgi:hypothetical protein
MSSDPNARRDKALSDISQHLSEINRTLKQIEHNTRPRAVVPEVTARQMMIRDPYDQPQVPQGSEVPEPGKDEEVKKFPAPTHPYLKRSLSVNVSDEVTEKNDRRAEVLADEGPYGKSPAPGS